MKEDLSTKTVEELQEKLRWYALEATEEEFDQEEVNKIAQLLNILDPIDNNEYNAESSFERFRQKYPDLFNSRKSKRQRLAKSLITVAASFVLAIFVFNIGLYAVNETGFFSNIELDNDQISFIISGEPSTIETFDQTVDMVEFKDLSELKDMFNDLLMPTSVPEDKIFVKATMTKDSDFDLFYISYLSDATSAENYGNTNTHLCVIIHRYSNVKEVSKQRISLPSDTDFVGVENISGKDISFYQHLDETIAIFFDSTSAYKISADMPKEKVIDFIKTME